MSTNKGPTHRDHHNGKTEVVPEIKIPKYARDPGKHAESQPIGKNIPHFLIDSFAKPGWNR